MLTLLAVLVGGTMVGAQEINWQTAVERLTFERTEVEKCVRLLKKHGDPAAIDRGELAYEGARSEYNAVIAGLTVALARKQQPASLPDLQARLQSGFEKRQAFCARVEPLVPQGAGGEKGILDEIVKGALEPVIEALQAIYMRHLDDDVLTRGTIQTQLEAAKWPAFASVAPSS